MLADRVRMGVQSGSWLDELPGPKKLVGGNMQVGFFGETPVSELINGLELANLVNLNSGRSMYSNEPWLKFAYKDSILYKSKKPFRCALNWNELNDIGIVDGSRIINIDNLDYRIRLIRGGDGTGEDTKNSEWNKLMLPIHINAETQLWRSAELVDVPTEYWGIDYTDNDLGVNIGTGGYDNICMDEVASNSSRITCRGWNGISTRQSKLKSDKFADRGWSPVLEVVK